MRITSLALVLLIAVAFGVSAEIVPTFAERVSTAKTVADLREIKDYIETLLTRTTRPFVLEAVRICTNHPCASTDAFTVVADVRQDGTLSNIDHEPKTDASECFANALGRLRVPLPPLGVDGVFPIVFEIEAR